MAKNFWGWARSVSHLPDVAEGSWNAQGVLAAKTPFAGPPETSRNDCMK